MGDVWIAERAHAGGSDGTVTSFYGSSCDNHGKGTINTPVAGPRVHGPGGRGAAGRLPRAHRHPQHRPQSPAGVGIVPTRYTRKPSRDIPAHPSVIYPQHRPQSPAGVGIVHTRYTRKPGRDIPAHPSVIYPQHRPQSPAGVGIVPTRYTRTPGRRIPAHPSVIYPHTRLRPALYTQQRTKVYLKYT
eukprot:8765137-Pyramimonas_sp.AAC.1